MENYAEIFGRLCERESVDYAEKMPDYADISSFNTVFPRFLRKEWICFQLLNLGKHPKLSNLVTSNQAPH